MRQVLIAAAALVAAAGASSASAMASEAVAQSKQVTIDGASLDYVSSSDAAGRRYLVGTETVTGKRFNFRVTPDGYVSGTVDGKPVAFRAPRAQRERSAGLARQHGAGARAGSR